MSKIRPLYEEERIRAWNAARDRIAGPELQESSFKIRTGSKYPMWLLILVVFLCIVVFSAAFIPSAYRLFIAGSSTFCTALQEFNQSSEVVTYDPRCDNVGNATIVLAEIGQIVFFFALAVIGAPDMIATRRRVYRGGLRFPQEDVTIDRNGTARAIFWMGVILSTLIAIVGNAHVSRPWDHGNYFFAHLETYVPPIIIMAIGYVFKELSLVGIATRYRRAQEFIRASQERQELYDNPERAGGKWLRAYTIALRDEIRRANSRNRAELQSLSRDDWNQLIADEMRLSDWSVDPSQPTRLEQQRVRQLVLEKGSLEDSTIPVELDWNEIIDNGDGTFTARSKMTGKTIGEKYASEGYARNALRNHHRSTIRSGERPHDTDS